MSFTIDGEHINITMFPDNTSQVWLLPDKFLKRDTVTIKWRYSLESDVMQLAQLKMLLDYHGVQADLVIKYLPYARQDKPVSNQATFALRTFAKILNNMYFTQVLINDPHSSQAISLINNSCSYFPIGELRDTIAVTKTDTICYPDFGARNKYTEAYNSIVLETIYGDKSRDQRTGHITYGDFLEEDNIKIKDKTILIVDDICDGGMTFKLCAKKLYDAGAHQVNLFVTHGIFSKGIRTLQDDRIGVYTPHGLVTKINETIHYRSIKC